MLYLLFISLARWLAFVTPCSGEAEVPFCMSARAGQCLAFSVFIVLAGSCLPFPAKRNGGGFVVGSGSNDNSKYVYAIFGEILMKR